MCLTAPSQGGVKQDVGSGGLHGRGGDFRHLVVIKLVPALFESILTVGCVMAAIQTPVVVLVMEKKMLSLFEQLDNHYIEDLFIKYLELQF